MVIVQFPFIECFFFVRDFLLSNNIFIFLSRVNSLLWVLSLLVSFGFIFIIFGTEIPNGQFSLVLIDIYLVPKFPYTPCYLYNSIRFLSSSSLPTLLLEYPIDYHIFYNDVFPYSCCGFNGKNISSTLPPIEPKIWQNASLVYACTPPLLKSREKFTRLKRKP